PDKRVYAPGERGAIKAVFDFGTRSGSQEKEITVMSDDEISPLTKLSLKVQIPALMQLSPSFLVWVQHEDPLPKVIYMRVVNAKPIHVIRVDSDNPKLQGELKTVTPGREYIYVLTPESTNEEMKAVLSIVTDYPEKKPRRFPALVQIRN